MIWDGNCIEIREALKHSLNSTFFKITPFLQFLTDIEFKIMVNNIYNSSVNPINNIATLFLFP